MTTAIDLFAGLGGWSTGASMAGVQVLWAANHWPEAVQWHANNHPDTQHVCQDLHQADWTQVPAHDLLLASPLLPRALKGAWQEERQPTARRQPINSLGRCISVGISSPQSCSD